MSEMSFVLNADEERLFVSAVFETGAWMIPNLHFQTPAMPTIVNVEEYYTYREKTSLFFILHDSYKLCPIELSAGEKHGARFFFVMQRNGRPTINYLSTSQFMKDGKLNLNPGFLSYYPTFWNTIVGENQKSPSSLPVLFRRLSANLRARSKSIRFGKRTYMVGKKTIEQVEAGRIEIGFPISCPD
jgi:hypothetical protein